MSEEILAAEENGNSVAIVCIESLLPPGERHESMDGRGRPRLEQAVVDEGSFTAIFPSP